MRQTALGLWAMIVLFLALVLLPIIGAGQFQFPEVCTLELGEGGFVDFSPDSRCLVASLFESDGLTLVDASTWGTQKIGNWNSDRFCFGPDGSLLVSGSVFLSTATWSRLNVSLDFDQQVNAFSPNGRTFASYGGESEIVLWDVSTWRELHRMYIREPKSGVSYMAFTPDGTRLVASSFSETTVWDVETSELLFRFETQPFGAPCQISPDGRSLVVFQIDGKVHFLDIESGRDLSSFVFFDGRPPMAQLPGFMTTVAAFTPNWQFVMAPSGATVAVFSIPSGKKLASLEGDPVSVTAVAVSNDGTKLASIGRTGRLRIWDISALNTYSCTGFVISKTDWVKGCVTIRNTTTSQLDLIGWKLSDGDGVYTFASNLVVAAGQTYSVCPDVYNPSKSNRGLKIDETDDAVSLYSSEICGATKESTKRQ